jgi:hypothetical protein
LRKFNTSIHILGPQLNSIPVKVRHQLQWTSLEKFSSTCSAKERGIELNGFVVKLVALLFLDSNPLIANLPFLRWQPGTNTSALLRKQPVKPSSAGKRKHNLDMTASQCSNNLEASLN